MNETMPQLCPGRTDGTNAAHCWHTSNIQHTMTNHVCEVCCFCGKDRCRSTIAESAARRLGHGEFAP